MDQLLIFRGIERLLIVACGAFLIYLGYRLFGNLPEKTDSEGKLILPGQISVYMSRVGPGAFFALFGAVRLGVSVFTQLQFGNGEDGERGDVRYMSTGGRKDAGAATVGTGPVADEVRDIILDINSDFLPLVENVQPTDEARQTARSTILHSKLKLMKLIWDEQEWGSFDEFSKWALSGSPPSSTEILEPAAIFNNSTHIFQ